jgi:hypothetical protein
MSTDTPSWTPPAKPSFNSPAADLNQLRNEAKRIAESAPGQPVHKAVLERARQLAAAIEHDLGLPQTPEGLSYADLAVLLSQSK